MSESECRQFEKKLAHFTAPTLLGIKCASLVSLSREEFDIPSYAAAFNARAEKGGLQMQIMCRCQKRLLVLCIARNCCKSGWKSRQSGSSCIDMGTQMTWIWQPVLCGCKKRIAEKPEFPPRDRDILGYPLEDVDGFITHQGENCKLCGCWKVYGNVEQARRTFANPEKQSISLRKAE
ncbi:MAG: DUF3793 family protein [Ruminococcus sp.]